VVRDLQVVLGHVSLETTMGYVHPEASRVISPLRAYRMDPEFECEPRVEGLQSQVCKALGCAAEER